jgi:hypothetical protein
MVQQTTDADLEQMGLGPRDIDRFMAQVDQLKRVCKVNLQQNTAAKKKLVMRFVEGKLSGTKIVLNVDEMPIVFGAADPSEVQQ